MKFETLMSAVRSAQLLMVILPMGAISDKARIGISQLRARIENHVANASINNSTSSVNYLEHLHSEVFKNIPVNMDDASFNSLNSLAVLNSHLGYEKSMSFSSLRGVGVKSYKVVHAALDFYIESCLVLMAEKDQAEPKSFKSKEEEAARLEKLQDERGSVVHDFSSIVRNSDWLYVLSCLKIQNPSDFTRINSGLSAKHGSRQGYFQRNNKIYKITQDEDFLAQIKGKNSYALIASGKTAGKSKTKSKTKAKDSPILVDELVDASMFTTTVSLKQEVLMSHPFILDAMQNSSYPSKADATDSLSIATMITEACAPTVVHTGVSSEQVAQEKMDDLMRSLTRRNLEINALRAKDKKAVAEKQKESAISALRGIDKKLLKLIQDNPELLKQISIE